MGKRIFENLCTRVYCLQPRVIIERVGNMLNERKNCILASVKQINVSHVRNPAEKTHTCVFFFFKNTRHILYSNNIIDVTIRSNYNSLTFCENII